MIIALDLDNTIIKYDGLFHQLALERGLIPPDLPEDKTAVRDHLRLRHGDEAWQELQALAYGPRLPQATLFPDARETLARWKGEGHAVHIVSHKTSRSARGGYELRPAARNYLSETGIKPLITGLFFADTPALKIEQVNRLNCDVLVDDLPEILSHPDLSADINRILFGSQAADDPGAVCCLTWNEIAKVITALDHKCGSCKDEAV